MTSTTDIETLKQEQAMLAQRAQDSKREADHIRHQLQESQAALNTAEEQLNLAQQAVNALEQQLITARAHFEQCQVVLQSAHQQTATFAQQLGPAAQKQKRFDEALSVVENNLRLAQPSSLGSPLGGGSSLGASSLGGSNLGRPGGMRATPASPFASPQEPRLTPQSPFAKPAGGPPPLSPQVAPVVAPSSAVPSQPVVASGPPVLPAQAAPTSSASPASQQPEQGARSPRVALQVEMSFQLDINAQSAHNFYTGFTNNISEGGVFIATPHLLDIGTQIKFPLKLPNMEVPELVEGTVRWVRREEHVSHLTPSGLGVQFNALDERLRRLVNDYIQQNESIFYDE